MTDLSAASPVETLVTGHNDPTTFAFTDGACASARFAEVRGIDALADGSIVVADLGANAILHITNPTAANCAVEYWAGNNTPNSDLDITNPPDAGDMDGDGAAAKFSGPAPARRRRQRQRLRLRQGNHKIKKVGGAAPHTVTTVATLPADGPDNLTSMVLIGNKIYAAGATGAAAFVVSRRHHDNEQQRQQRDHRRRRSLPAARPDHVPRRSPASPPTAAHSTSPAAATCGS